MSVLVASQPRTPETASLPFESDQIDQANGRSPVGIASAPRPSRTWPSIAVEIPDRLPSPTHGNDSVRERDRFVLHANQQ
jgi:hypothetical protein